MAKKEKQKENKNFSGFSDTFHAVLCLVAFRLLLLFFFFTFLPLLGLLPAFSVPIFPQLFRVANYPTTFSALQILGFYTTPPPLRKLNQRYIHHLATTFHKLLFFFIDSQTRGLTSIQHV